MGRKALQCSRNTPQGKGRQLKQAAAWEQVEAKKAGNKGKEQSGQKPREKLKGVIDDI